MAAEPPVPFRGAERSFTIEEPFGLSWGPDRVSYVVEFEKGKAMPDGIGLKDRQGRSVAVQLSEVELWADQTLRKAKLSFLVTLKPGENASWSLSARRGHVEQPRSDLAVRDDRHTIELSNSKTGIRLVGGKRTFNDPIEAEKVPSPIQKVRLPNGRWPLPFPSKPSHAVGRCLPDQLRSAHVE